MEKEYYTLEEAERRFGLSFENFKYLIQESQITPVFYLENQQYIVGSWHKGIGFVGHASVFYKGLVHLHHDTQLALINKGRVRALEFGLIKRQNMQHIDVSYPFRTPTPNTFLHSWEPLDKQALLERPLGARLFPKEGINLLELVGSLVEGIADISQKAKETDIVEKADGFEITPNSNLKPESEKFDIKDQNQLLKTTDILVLHQDLVRLGIIKEQPVPLSQELGQEQAQIENKAIETKPDELPAPETPKKRSNQLTELLERILLANPKISAKEAWRVLEDEVSKDLDERTYDTDGILKDVSHSEIAWQSRYGNSSITKLSTFDSSVSRAKKRIGLVKS